MICFLLLVSGLSLRVQDVNEVGITYQSQIVVVFPRMVEGKDMIVLDHVLSRKVDFLCPIELLENSTLAKSLDIGEFQQRAISRQINDYRRQVILARQRNEPDYWTRYAEARSTYCKEEIGKEKWDRLVQSFQRRIASTLGVAAALKWSGVELDAERVRNWNDIERPEIDRTVERIRADWRDVVQQLHKELDATSKVTEVDLNSLQSDGAIDFSLGAISDRMIIPQEDDDDREYVIKLFSRNGSYSFPFTTGRARDLSVNYVNKTYVFGFFFRTVIREDLSTGGNRLELTASQISEFTQAWEEFQNAETEWNRELEEMEKSNLPKDIIYKTSRQNNESMHQKYTREFESILAPLQFAQMRQVVLSRSRFEDGIFSFTKFLGREYDTKETEKTVEETVKSFNDRMGRHVDGLESKLLTLARQHFDDDVDLAFLKSKRTYWPDSLIDLVGRSRHLEIGGARGNK